VRPRGAACYGSVVRTAFIAFVVFAFAARTEAASLGVPALSVDVSLAADVLRVVDAASSLPALALTTVDAELLAGRNAPSIPSHYAWIERDTRAFWYAAGASAVTTLGSHVLAGIPTIVVGGNVLNAMLTSGSGQLAGAIAVLAGLYALYTVVESALAAGVSMLVFDSMSETYEGRFASGFLAHFAGSIASTAVTTLTFGGGAMLFHGMGLLGEFTGGAGMTSVQIFSFLGAMPAVVIAGTALIAVPALATAWGLAAGAKPREGFAIDENWTSPSLSQAPHTDPGRQRAVATVPVAMPLSLPLPSL